MASRLMRVNSLTHTTWVAVRQAAAEGGREAQAAARRVVARRHDGPHVVHHHHRRHGEAAQGHLGVRDEHDVGAACGWRGAPRSASRHAARAAKPCVRAGAAIDRRPAARARTRRAGW